MGTMAGKKKGSPYRRVKPQKTAIVPTRTPGNHPVAPEVEDAAPKIDRLIVPGEKPVMERVVERRIRQERFDGPIPHPELLRQYGQVIPNAPERILKVFEEDSYHIRDMQSRALDAQKEDNRRVQWMAFSLIGGGYLTAILFAVLDKNALAGIVLTTTIIGTVVGFLQNRHQKSEGSTSEESQTGTKKPDTKPSTSEARQLEGTESDT